jgi:hypothetical protein
MKIRDVPIGTEVRLPWSPEPVYERISDDGRNLCRVRSVDTGVYVRLTPGTEIEVVNSLADAVKAAFSQAP